MKTLKDIYRLFILLLVISQLCMILVPVQQVFAQYDQLENLDAYIDKSMKEWQIPGLAIAIVKDDEVIFNKGFGFQMIPRALLV